ncbi:MAG: HlyD family efflux transporter periplasmic adaptor subunit [Verrucomicrobiales bacterium]|nr:HlyD family efflux transporter periplasmic adaptor subunit [Verrucomicrobiales bacterium]
MTPRLTTPRSEASPVDWLPDEPPPRLARLAGWCLIGIFTAALLTAVLLRLPETVRCRFTLIPAEGADPIQSPVNGVLQQVRAAEGQEVESGAVLFEIRSDEVLTWQTELNAAENDLHASEQRTQRSEETYAALLKINQAGGQQITQELGFRTNYLNTVKKFVTASQTLYEAKLISEVENQKAKLEQAAGEKELHITEQSLNKNALEHQQLETERDLHRSEEQATVSKLKGRIASLRQRLVNCESGVLTVRAPFHAMVISVAQRNPGSVVRPGLELCQLARIEGRPVADLKIPQSGLDQVAPGQAARLFFDAFPYQRYGARAARIDWVSPSAVATGSDLQFHARATLDRDSFPVNGTNVPVRIGMMGEARIRVGERTLIEYVFEPLKALRERSR